MHYCSQQTRIESPIHHHHQQPQPQPPSPQQTTPKDNFVVDERWDGGDLFIVEPEMIKGHQAVKSLSISTTATTSTEMSPPLSSPLKCNQELFTSCFREDIDDADYFSDLEEEEDKQGSDQTFVRYIDTPVSPLDSVYEVVDQEQDCDYLTSSSADKDNKPTTTTTTTQHSVVKRNKEEEDDDLLIESVNDQSHEENNNCAVVTGPVSFEYYHGSLVQHYKTILFSLSNDEKALNIYSTLPPIYKQYLVDLKHHMNSILPSTV